MKEGWILCGLGQETKLLYDEYDYWCNEYDKEKEELADICINDDKPRTCYIYLKSINISCCLTASKNERFFSYRLFEK